MTTTAAPSLDDLVDPTRYPLSSPGSAGWTRAVDRARAELADRGCSVLPGFLRPEVVEAVRLRHYVTGEWLLGLSGLVSLLFGLVLFAFPVGGVVGLAWLLGVYAIAMGVARIALGAEIQSSVTA